MLNFPNIFEGEIRLSPRHLSRVAMSKAGETRATKATTLRKDQVRPLPTKRARMGTNAEISSQRLTVSCATDHIGHRNVQKGRPTTP